MRTHRRIRPLVALAIAGSTSLAALSATAEPQAAQPPAVAPPPQYPQPPAPPPQYPPYPQPPSPGALVAGATPSLPGFAPPGDGSPGGLPIPKPTLASELPIASYIITPITAGAGAALNVFGASAASDLKDPEKHTTPDQTHSLVVKARVGQVISYVMFPITGLTTLWGTISTIRAVMKISKLAKPPPALVGAAPTPGGLALGVVGRF